MGKSPDHLNGRYCNELGSVNAPFCVALLPFFFLFIFVTPYHFMYPSLRETDCPGDGYELLNTSTTVFASDF